MNAKILIAIVATFAMLVTGMAVADVSAVDAEPVEVEEGPVAFTVGDMTYWINVDKSGETDPETGLCNIILPSLEKLGCTLAEGKSFVGWNVLGAVEESDPCYPAGTVISHSFVAGAHVSYKAKLADVQYTVTFIDGDKAPETVSGTLNSSVSVPIEITPAEGYVFDGWFNGEDMLEVDDGNFTIKGTATYTAKYSVDPVISFKVDDATIYTSALSKMTYPSDPAKDDFTFLGWAIEDKVVLDADLGRTGVATIKALELEEDTEFFAVFEPALHTVTFTVDGKVVSTQTVKHGEKAIEPAFEPARDGYEFAGWDFDFSAPVVADVTIPAKFTVVVEPEPEGLDDPVTQTAVILGGLVAIILLAVLISKVKKGEPILGLKVEKAKKKDKEDDE